MCARAFCLPLLRLASSFRLNILFSICAIVLSFSACGTNENSDVTKSLVPESDGAYHVRPGESIQAAIEAAATDESVSVVKVHEGTYRPSKLGQAFIWFNKKHDGLTLEAVGEVTLTAANEDISVITSASHPAIVNHVIYIGDGVTAATKISGFRITGANGMFTRDGVDVIEPDMREDLRPGHFFFSDGGAIKIYGNASPVLSNLEIYENEVYLCGGGISVEQRSVGTDYVTIRNCVFRGNRSPATGSAIDLLEGSKGRIENCLFVDNVGNYGMADISKSIGLTYKPEHGCGALTVFPKSTAIVTNCTFTNNWNGVDDDGIESRYKDCIFWKNTNGDGSRAGAPFEMDVNGTTNVEGCTIFGGIADLKKTVDIDLNKFGDVDPEFDESFVPRSMKHQMVGYRPTGYQK